MSYKYSLEEVKGMDDYELRDLIKDANSYHSDKAEKDFWAKMIVLGIAVLVLIIASLMLLLPNYGVWKAELDGKAKLAEAEYSKKVLVQEAQSNLEAEKLNAEAEVERAKGAAEARKTEGLGMTAEQYIQYLWVKKLDLSQSKTIYLPTEGGLPKMTFDVKE